MRIPFGKPLIDSEEVSAVLEVLGGPILVQAPKANTFESLFAEFANSSHAVSVSSCTAGMHLLYFSMGLKEGDEVIVPAQTHVATAHAVELCGATQCSSMRNRYRETLTYPRLRVLSTIIRKRLLLCITLVFRST